MFRSIFEEHIHSASALTANRTAAGSANALIYVVLHSNPADNFLAMHSIILWPLYC